MKTGFKILISLAAAALAGVFSLFSHVLLLPVVALAAYMGSEWGEVYLVPVLAAMTAAMLAAFKLDAPLIITLALFLSAAVFLTVYGKKRFPHRYAVLALAALFTLGVYLSITIVPMLEGRPPYEDAVEMWEEGYAKAMSGIAADYSDTAQSFSQAIPTVLMLTCILTGELASMALVLLFRLCHRIFGTSPAPMAKLRNWRLPANSLLGALIMLAAIGLVYLFKVAQANAIALALGGIIVTLFSVQGLAFMTFVLQVSEAPRGLRIFLWAFIVLAFPYSLLVLTFIGVREQIRDRRRMIIKSIREARPMTEAQRRAEEYEKYGYIREDKADGSAREKDDENKENKEN
jgi:hypothetical protein